MRVRCFFGTEHGRWAPVDDAALKAGRIAHPKSGAIYRLHQVGARWWIAVLDGKSRADAYDWLFTHDPAHPQHTTDANHPRNLSKSERLGVMYGGAIPDAGRFEDCDLKG